MIHLGIGIYDQYTTPCQIRLNPRNFTKEVYCRILCGNPAFISQHTLSNQDIYTYFEYTEYFQDIYIYIYIEYTEYTDNCDHCTSP